MGVQACRLPAPKRFKRLKRLKPLKLAKAFRNAQPRRHKLSQGQIHRFFWAVQELPQGQIHRFFWAVQPAVCQAFAANRHPKATSMASYGRPSLPLKLAKAFRNAQPRRHKLSPSAVQPVVLQAFAANRQPKATSMASYGCPSLPFASP